MAGSDRISHYPASPVGASQVALKCPQRQPASRFDQRLADKDSAEERARQQALGELRALVRAIRAGVRDPWQLTDLIFYTRHPQMAGVPLTEGHSELLEEWNSISALLVQPTLNEVYGTAGASLPAKSASGVDELQATLWQETGPRLKTEAVTGGQVHLYDEVILSAVELCPGLQPSILKGLLAQESNFKTSVINQYGYAGIAQFGREAAREVGLRVGIAGSETDERLNPLKAIPAAARLLNLKAERLSETAFARYGQPDEKEFWKFVLAAYNGGEATVALAMGHAYRSALATAGARGLIGPEAVSFARKYAARWENLTAGGLNSPLGQAAARYFPALAAQKYQEIGDYPKAIYARSSKS